MDLLSLNLFLFPREKKMTFSYKMNLNGWPESGMKGQLEVAQNRGYILYGHNPKFGFTTPQPKIGIAIHLARRKSS
jgi:hypothetical protein